jgi:glycosyltransferase 2 family protein
MRKSTLLKIFLTGLFLAVILVKVSVFDIARVMLSLNPFYFAGAVLLVPMLIFLRNLRWNLFLRSAGVDIPLFQSLKVLLIGNFYGLITPGHIGEIGRAYHMDEKKVITLPTIVLEKIIDICTLTGLSLVTILVFFPTHSVMVAIIILCCVAVPVGIFLLMNKKIVHFIIRFFGIGRDESGQFAGNLKGLVTNYKLVGFSFFITLIYYITAYVLGYLIIRSAGFNPAVFITLPIIVLMGNIPLTIAGIGLRESVGSVLFIYLGETAADGFVFAFLLFILVTVLPAFVGYIFAMRGYENWGINTGQINGLLSPYLESRRMEKITGIVTGGSILDYGCGSGKIIPLLSFTRYTGTDLNRSVLSEARKEYSDTKNVFFYTIEEFETLQEKYDFIILSAVIEHFRDPMETLTGLSRRLQNQGKIVITTPTPRGNNLLRIGSKLGIFSRNAFEEHNQILSKNEFITISAKLNLKIIKYDSFEIGMNQIVVLAHEG